MASFEPIVVLFGSGKNLSTINFRLPVSFVFATDEPTLDELLSVDPQLFTPCLQRYFVILLQSIKDDVFERLENNHRVQAIYTQEKLTCHSKLHRTINKQLQQFTLDLTGDIVQFLTIEGEKQAKLERLHLTKIYFRQVRLLKEWAMSFARAEPNHILVIPLNTNQENLNSAIERIEKLCHKLGHPSVIIRTLDTYLPSIGENRSCLLPYSETLFQHEHPQYICELISKLSPIRLYLYGNEKCISNDWSHLMINRETQVMEDEDNWCAFIENEYIEDEMKWNIGPMFGALWRVKRLAPINLTELDQNLRFQSALCRAFKTFSPRQIEITSEIFIWYDKCISDGYFELEPKLSFAEVDKKNGRELPHPSNGRVQNPSSFRYGRIPKFKSLSFIWLDEILNSSNDYLNEIIQPFTWNFFDNVSQCLPFIEIQLREQNQIFLVASGALGYELFISAYRLMATIPSVYIYCSRLGLHGNWIKYYSQIRGVFNDSLRLGEQIKGDMEGVYRGQTEKNIPSVTQRGLVARPQAPPESTYDPTVVSLPIIVYNEEEAHVFISHQRTIDTLLCLPYDQESRTAMMEELHRIYSDDHSTLAEIDIFNQTYNSNSALQWYTRDSFLFRTINRALRSSDVEMMFKLRYFLIDLYAQLDGLYRQSQQFSRDPVSEKLYRGQIMSRNQFDSFQQLIGQIISINTFLSTTTSLQIALVFAHSSSINDEFLSVVFCIETNSYAEQKRPYANISQFSIYHDEEEVLFAMGSLFRIQSIEPLDSTDNIPIIHLQMIDQTEVNGSYTL